MAAMVRAAVDRGLAYIAITDHGQRVTMARGLDETRLRRQWERIDALNAALAGPGDVDVENDNFTVHNPTVLGADSPMPVLVAALGPVMLQIAGELTDGTVLWMADERAIGDHIAPKITKAAENAGRKAPRIVAGIPVCLCANTEIEAAQIRRALRLTSGNRTETARVLGIDLKDGRVCGVRTTHGTIACEVGYREHG